MNHQPHDPAELDKRHGKDRWRAFRVKSLDETFVVGPIPRAKYRQLAIAGKSPLDDYEGIAIASCISHVKEDGLPDEEYLKHAFDLAPHLEFSMASAAVDMTYGDLDSLKAGSSESPGT